MSHASISLQHYPCPSAPAPEGEDGDEGEGEGGDHTYIALDCCQFWGGLQEVCIGNMFEQFVIIHRSTCFYIS